QNRGRSTSSRDPWQCGNLARWKAANHYWLDCYDDPVACHRWHPTWHAGNLHLARSLSAVTRSVNQGWTEHYRIYLPAGYRCVTGSATTSSTPGADRFRSNRASSERLAGTSVRSTSRSKLRIAHQRTQTKFTSSA